MFVIQSGFESVKDLALAPNRLAVLNGERPYPSAQFRGLQAGQQIVPAADGITWDAEVWSLPPDAAPQRFSVANTQAEGFVFDLRTGWLLRCGPMTGVRRADGQIVAAPDQGGGISGFTISPDGDRMICIAGWQDMSVFETPPPVRYFLLFHRSGDGGWVRQQAIAYTGEFALEQPAFLPDGERFVATDRQLYTNSRRTHQYHMPVLQVFDAMTCTRRETANVGPIWPRHHFCGSYLATFCSSGVTLYDTRDFAGEPLFLKTGRRKIKAIGTDPNGRFLLIAHGHRVSVWETKKWSEVKTFAWKAGPITCLAVAPDGLTAAAGTATGKVVVWDVE